MHLLHDNTYKTASYKEKTIVPLFLILLSCHILSAQINLVQNPSFEQGPCDGINFFQGQPAFWDTLRAGGGGYPEYLTECASVPQNSVPTNAYMPSYQMPKSGTRYCLYTWYLNPFPAPVIEDREYIQNELKQKLHQGKSYCVTFNVSLVNESKYAITELGAYLDDGTIFTTHRGTSTLSPQIKSPSGVFISDTLGWTKIQGVFTANGTEKYITLGNYKLNTNTTFTPVFPASTRNIADYYVDDVSVIEADLVAFAGRDTVICTGDSVFIGRPPEVGLECNWQTLTSSVSIANGAGLWVKPAASQTYVVTQDVCGLLKKDTIQVQIKPKYNGPAIGLSTSSPSTCPNQTLQLSIQNKPPVNKSYQWLPQGVYTQTSNTGASAVVGQNTTFTCNLFYNGEDAFCPFQRTAQVSVAVPMYTDTPALQAAQDPVCPNDTIVLNVASVPGQTVTYRWLPTSAYTYTSSNMAKGFTQLGSSFSVNISSTGNASLCAFTRSVSVQVAVADTCFKEPEVPNIFTPNNDGSNEVWYIRFPYGSALENIAVYNRWGTLIYERSNLSFDKQAYALIGWDGYTTSGEACSAGVYVYVLRYTSRSGESKVLKGNVTLLR